MLLAQYDGTCYGCGEEILKGQQIAYFGAGETYHYACRPLANDVKRTPDDHFKDFAPPTQQP